MISLPRLLSYVLFLGPEYPSASGFQNVKTVVWGLGLGVKGFG